MTIAVHVRSLGGSPCRCASATGSLPPGGSMISITCAAACRCAAHPGAVLVRNFDAGRAVVLTARISQRCIGVRRDHPHVLFRPAQVVCEHHGRTVAGEGDDCTGPRVVGGEVEASG